jgi:hypothetical protein
VEVQISPAYGIPEPGHDGSGILTELRRAVVLGWIGPESCTDHGPAGGQRPARPPDMQSRDMAVANGLLPAGMLADLLYGEVNFDEALGVWDHKVLSHLALFSIFGVGSGKLQNILNPDTYNSYAVSSMRLG